MFATTRMTAISCWILLFGAANASAQDSASADERPLLQAGGGFVGAVAVGEFGTDVGGAAGVLLHIDVGLGGSVFSVGGEFGALSYGSESRRAYIGNVIPDIPDLSLKVDTDNEMWLLHARVRAQRRTGRWRPYADVLGGMTDLSTKTSISGALSCRAIPSTGVICDSETAAEATNATDRVPSYGAAAGVMMAFNPRGGGVKLDVSVRWHRGGTAQYLAKGAITREGDRAILDVSRSRTDMVMVYVGVAFGR